MEARHPKRRKDKYNPYTIFERDNHYYISFKNGQGEQFEMEINQSLYNVFNEFELSDLSYLNEWDRHIEHSEVWESTLDVRAVNKLESVEDIVIKKYEKGQLYSAIEKLSRKQMKRLILHYFCGLNIKEIAKRENCTTRAVEYSLRNAIKRLKELLEKF